MVLVTMAVRLVVGVGWREVVLVCCVLSVIFSSCARPTAPSPLSSTTPLPNDTSTAASNTMHVHGAGDTDGRKPPRVTGERERLLKRRRSDFEQLLFNGRRTLPLPTDYLHEDDAISDHLTPYPSGRHGSTRSVRDACDHSERTYEEFQLASASSGDTVGPPALTLPRPPRTDKVQYDLRKFMDTSDGMRYMIGTIAFLEDPYYTLSVLEPSGEGGCDMKYFSASRRSVLETASKRKQGCKLAANAGFFSMTNGQCYGNVVSNSRIVQTAGNSQNANFGIRRDGTMVIGYLPDEEIYNKTNPFRQLVSGVIWLVRNGTNIVNKSMEAECSSHEDTGAMEVFVNVRSARTAIGHDAQGRVVLAQVEGQTHRRGANLYEFADLLIRKGVVNAINLDGGGSNTLLENNVLVNYPSDHCPWHGEYRCARAVSTILCVHDVECIEPDCSGHGSCDHGLCSCDPLWYGDGCQLINCSKTNCSGHGVCENGTCNCNAGWEGQFCETPCPSGRYGENCQSYCWCFGKSKCSSVTGKCLCEPGYMGYACMTECKKGTYGAGCTEKCIYPNCSNNGFCSPKDGSCICNDGWEGINCSSPAVPFSLNDSSASPDSRNLSNVSLSDVATSVAAAPTDDTPTSRNEEVSEDTPATVGSATCPTSTTSGSHLKVTIGVSSAIGIVTLLFHGFFCLLMHRLVVRPPLPLTKRRTAAGKVKQRQLPKNLRKKRPRSQFLALMVKSSTESSSL